MNCSIMTHTKDYIRSFRKNVMTAMLLSSIFLFFAARYLLLHLLVCLIHSYDVIIELRELYTTMQAANK